MDTASQLNDLNNLYGKYQEDTRLDHLRRPWINFVPGQGPVNPTLMLVGEAPGKIENSKKTPFIGPAGELLNKLLSEINLSRSDVFVTNVIKYWPQNPHDKSTNRQPSFGEVLTCREYLMKEIEIVDPLIIGLCGWFPLQTVFPELTQVYANHGKLLEGQFVPLYHPAVILYDKTPEKAKEKLVRQGFQEVNRYIQQTFKATG